MKHSKVLLLFFLSVVLHSEAFQLPVKKTKSITKHTLVIFAQEDESTASLNERKYSNLEEKLSDRPYETPQATNVLQQRFETALAPAADFLENASGGWALSYADLTPNRCV